MLTVFLLQSLPSNNETHKNIGAYINKKALISQFSNNFTFSVHFNVGVRLLC